MGTSQVLVLITFATYRVHSYLTVGAFLRWGGSSKFINTVSTLGAI